MRRRLFEDEHELFRDSVRAFFNKEVAPHHEQWERDGIVPRSLFEAAGDLGILGMAIPTEYGGGGVADFRYNVVVAEEIQRAGVNAAGLGLTVHSDIIVPYFLRYSTDAQRARWLPGLASGALISAIAMTEPGIGSDLAGMATTAVLVGDLPQERLSIAVTGIAAAAAALDWTLEYAKERHAFGQPIGTFQNSRFWLAEMRTEIEIGRTFTDRCVDALNAGELTAEEAAMAKWWCTELQKRVVDRCVQLHGGYGYMREYPIGRAYADARITTIYGGTTEIMKEIIGKSMGL